MNYYDAIIGGYLKLYDFFRKLIPRTVREKWFLGGKIRKLTGAVKVELSLPLKRKLKNIQFDIHLVEHCNLNCAGCNHFSPLAEPEFVSLEEFDREMKRMGELFFHKCNYISLMGGEPLLHPQVIALMETARRYFDHGSILLFTNGILLSRQNELFWETCQKNRIEIFITYYPIDIHITEVKNLAKKFNVVLTYEGDSENESKMFHSEPLDLSGNGNIKKNFAMCYRANRCIQLSHGRLYPCQYAAYVRHFIKKFNNVDISIDENDSIDIYQKGVDKRAILKRLSMPISMCRYCNLNFQPMVWRISKRSIEEWL